jgi:8-hydroxy-5-deazaflavin:NADPH oxidoreductase
MKVGILGSGVVAKTLAAGFQQHGHQVTVGTRTPANLAEWQTQNPGIEVATFESTAAFGDFIVLAVKGGAAAQVLDLAGAENLKGKTIADTCNPIKDAPPVDGVLPFFATHDQSLMEVLQGQFADANFVKVFNSVGSASMVNPKFPGGKPTMFICGNSQAAKGQVTKILDAFGWETADMGSAVAARAIEPLCILWCIPGFLHNEWTHAFKLLRRE